MNYSNVDRRRLGLTVSVAYGTNLQLAKDTIWKIINSYSEILSDPAPMVEVNTLAASSIDFAVRPWTKPEDYWKVYWRFQGEIVDRLAEVGISVPFNQIRCTYCRPERNIGYCCSLTRAVAFKDGAELLGVLEEELSEIGFSPPCFGAEYQGDDCIICFNYNRDVGEFVLQRLVVFVCRKQSLHTGNGRTHQPR